MVRHSYEDRLWTICLLLRPVLATSYRKSSTFAFAFHAWYTHVLKIFETSRHTSSVSVLRCIGGL